MVRLIPETLGELRRQIRYQLPDISQWPDLNIDVFVVDAIRFYGAEWPRAWRHVIVLETGDSTYSLPGAHTLRGVTGVEYPAGKSPPEFLYQTEQSSPQFASGSGYYCIIPQYEDTPIEDDINEGFIIFNDPVETGEFAIVTYLGGHSIPEPGEDDAQITVPVAHWEALIAFVNFRAKMAKESEKVATIETISIVVSQLGSEVRLAWKVYKDVMDRISYIDSEGGKHVSWQDVGGVGRVY
ncbi:MAG: hypothetical protein GY753_12780 [Gammaproteobacteria bacterium]|nr:hypothetical protein [Gammaproteobacteria bacterium]